MIPDHIPTDYADRPEDWQREPEPARNWRLPVAILLGAAAAEALHLFDSQPGALAAEPRHLSSPEPASLPRSATRLGPIGDPAAFSRALRRPARLWL